VEALAWRPPFTRLYRLFCEGDCLLAEINPLAVTGDDALQALDAKVTVDDSALYRHQELVTFRDEMEDNPFISEGRKVGVLFIPCDPTGTVTVISNGSGMIMSCIDVLAKNGVAVCAAMDLGGGATAERVSETVRIGLSDPKARAAFINIFGGITRCDEIAAGVRNFMGRHGTDKPVVVRFEGTNKEKGVEILSFLNRDNVVFVNGLYEGVDALVKRKAAQ
jgi:succinyl-CoA synthetase beta subunit